MALGDPVRPGPAHLAPSLTRFLGVEAENMDPSSLADDFRKFRFLLDATGGEGGSPSASREADGSSVMPAAGVPAVAGPMVRSLGAA